MFFKVDKEKTEFLEQFKDEKGEDRRRTIQELIIASDVGSIEVIVDKLSKMFCGKSVSYENVPHKKYVELYIVKKLYRIGFTYKKYWYYMYNPGVANDEPIALSAIFNKVQFDHFLEALSEDDTHITMKLRQAINYLRFNPLKNDDDGSWTKFSIRKKQAETFKIKFNDFAKRLIDFDDNIINCIPPSIFKFWLNINDEKEGESELEKMSSGELQLIYSIQSCLYHLNNLDSYKDSTNKDKIKYQNALLIFDEVELYFHPEFQRRLIKFLLDEIDQLGLDLVINIHALFVTHSPFIISDIPQNNLLKIETGEPKEFDSLTFAANIHELLKDTFYLDANTGQHSIEVINELIKSLNEVLALKGKPGKKEERERKISTLLLLDSHKIISAIGDVVVRRKLLTMYHECTKNEKVAKRKMIKEEISRLQTSLKDLKS